MERAFRVACGTNTVDQELAEQQLRLAVTVVGKQAQPGKDPARVSMKPLINER
jgi:hypothetical protein